MLGDMFQMLSFKRSRWPFGPEFVQVQNRRLTDCDYRARLKRRDRRRKAKGYA